MMPFSPKPRPNLQPKATVMPERHKIMLAGLELRPDLSGALHLPEMAALIISDLHLEKALHWRGAAFVCHRLIRISQSPCWKM